MTSDANRIDDAEEFSCDVTDSHGMRFLHLLPMMVIDMQGVVMGGGPAWRPDKERCAGATLPRLLILILPLHWPFFAHARVHAAIGQEAGFASPSSQRKPLNCAQASVLLDGLNVTRQSTRAHSA